MKNKIFRMNKRLIKTFMLLSSIMLTSCITNKKLTYLQYAGDPPPDTLVSVTPVSYKIHPFDNLFIRVVTPDPSLSEMFNTLALTAYGATITEQTADIISYAVDSAGFITIPYAGKIQVAGKNIHEITADIEEQLKEYISDAAITVKLINNYVSLIGEVERPGKYLIYKERLNILQALAMGSDLTDFSDRQKVQVIRQTSGGNVVKEFSLNDRSILSTEFYYVMPNDVIYAKPIKGRFFRMNEFPYTYILSTLTVIVLFFTVIKT
jgi:polysaccharide export outer membrane protein